MNQIYAEKTTSADGIWFFHAFPGYFWALHFNRKKVTKAKAKLPREAQKALNPAGGWLCTRNQIEASSTPHVRALCWAKGLGQFQSNLHLNISLGRNSTVMRVRDQGSLKKRWHLNAALWLVLLLGISASPERILQTVRPEATKPEERQKAQRFHWIWYTQCHKPSTKTQFLWVVIIGIFLLNGRFTIGLPTLFKMIQACLWWSWLLITWASWLLGLHHGHL